MCEQCKLLKGLHRVRRSLADGTKVTYYYARRGKGAPRLKSRHGTAAFVAEFWQLTMTAGTRVEIGTDGKIGIVREHS